MAAEAKFNSIMNEIQLSNLNFKIQLTPFAAYVTLKKTAQVDKHGLTATPSPPLFLLLQQSYRDISWLQNEISRLTADLAQSKQKCEDLDNVNATLLEKLTAVDKNLEDVQKSNSGLLLKLDLKDKEHSKLITIKNDLGAELKQMKTECDGLNSELILFKKADKKKNKELYDLNKNFTRSEEKIVSYQAELSEFKSRESDLKKHVSKLEKKLKRVETKEKQISSVSCQTNSVLDTQYSFLDALPPILDSKLYDQVNPTYVSKSVPDLVSLHYADFPDAGEDVLGATPADEDMVSCKFCDKTFKSEAYVKEHDESFPCACPLCRMCFATEEESANHQETVHKRKGY